MSSGVAHKKISSALQISSDTLHTTLERICAILYDGCVQEFRLNPPKPKISPTYGRNVGILVDTTYVPFPRVLDDYAVGRKLWDEHHKVYALKKQVCVQAGPPYLAIFSAPCAIGSTPDIDILRGTAEFIAQQTTVGTETCAVMGDKGYITSEPLPFTLITPKKVNMAGFSLEENFRIATARVHVERFFGRMKSSWKILSTKYRRAYGHFDRDFDILVALTNRLIMIRPVPTVEEDERYGSVYKFLKAFYRAEYIRKKDRKSRASLILGADETEEESAPNDG